mgnify:CR=1 FL=1
MQLYNFYQYLKSRSMYSQKNSYYTSYSFLISLYSKFVYITGINALSDTLTSAWDAMRANFGVSPANSIPHSWGEIALR